MKIQQAISSTILVVLLTAQMAWAQDNIRAAMEAANNEWSAAYNSLNGKAFPALYTKDAVLMPPGVQPINGSEAIGQFWADLIKAGNRKNFTIEIASIQRDGKYAYQTARWTLDLVKDNGEVTKVGGQHRPYFRRTAGRQEHDPLGASACRRCRCRLRDRVSAARREVPSTEPEI